VCTGVRVSVGVCMCVGVCVGVHVCMCVCRGVHGCACVCVCVCVVMDSLYGFCDKNKIRKMQEILVCYVCYVLC